MGVRSDYKLNGPVFTEVDGVVGRNLNQFEEDAGKLLVNRVRARLDSVLVNPTGHYRSKIDYTNVQGSTLITDSGVVYGPWLESGRSGTRFRGYSTFRRTAQEAEQEAAMLLEQAADRIVSDLS